MEVLVAILEVVLAVLLAYQPTAILHKLVAMEDLAAIPVEVCYLSVAVPE